MKRISRWNPKLGLMATCMLIIVLHFALKEMLARYDVVSCIFAAGEHVPRWMFSCAAVFALVRLFVILVVPPIFAWKLIEVLMSRPMLKKQ